MSIVKKMIEPWVVLSCHNVRTMVPLSFCGVGVSLCCLYWPKLTLVSILTIIIFSWILLLWVKIEGSRNNFPVQCFYFYLLIFSLSCIWTYVHHLEEARAVNDARKIQYLNLPRDCNYFGFWFYEKFFYWFRTTKYEDQCTQYFKETVDPFWKVNPAAAISDTFVMLLLQPAAIVGSSMGQFLSHATSVFPPWAQPFILLLAYVFLVVIVLFLFIGLFGFRISLPFISIKPTGSTSTLARSTVTKTLVDHSSPQRIIVRSQKVVKRSNSRGGIYGYYQKIGKLGLQNNGSLAP